MFASKVILSRLSSRCSSSPLILKLHKKDISTRIPPLKSAFSQSQIPDNVKRISRISRLPLELSSLESMMPLHSAIASARLKSILSAESQSWGMIPQVVVMTVQTICEWLGNTGPLHSYEIGEFQTIFAEKTEPLSEWTASFDGIQEL